MSNELNEKIDSLSDKKMEAVLLQREIKEATKGIRLLNKEFQPSAINRVLVSQNDPEKGVKKIVNFVNDIGTFLFLMKMFNRDSYVIDMLRSSGVNVTFDEDRLLSGCHLPSGKKGAWLNEFWNGNLDRPFPNSHNEIVKGLMEFSSGIFKQCMEKKDAFAEEMEAVVDGADAPKSAITKAVNISTKAKVNDNSSLNESIDSTVMDLTKIIEIIEGMK